MAAWLRQTIAIATVLIAGSLAARAQNGDKARAQEARVLATATDASLARGDYQAAISQAQRAFDLHERLGARADAAWDLNAIGLANQYLGLYSPALDAYRRALELDRAAGARDGEITRLNNIGNVHFLLGRYSDALAMYDDAAGKLGALAPPDTQRRLRRMTVANLAALNTRIGAHERALDLYARLPAGETMQPAEEAQLLVNQGALVRRLGDPGKALDLYRAAQRLFARAAHRDGEIGAWRNIGIVHALDLTDYARALEAFDTALRLARSSSNRRGEAQALLYRGEVLRRIGRDEEARRDLEAAFGTALATGLVEEQWKALYGLGLVAEARGDGLGARATMERAIAAIESVRADLKTVALRSEFLADKRDVYDALIWLTLRERPRAVGDAFRLMEQSRARTFRDRLQPDAGAPTLAAVQARLPADTLLLEYWVGARGMAMLWASHAAAGVVTRAAWPADLEAVQQLSDAVARKDSDWRTASVAAGEILLRHLPELSRIQHLLIVPDGALHFLPFETLTLPGAGTLLVERFAVSYLPAASFTLTPAAARGWAWPWQRALVAFGDPAPAGSYPLETVQWPPLPYAAEEVRRVAKALPGGQETYVGADARKQFVTDGRLRSVPVVHFSTHAVADTRDPDRSRILLAPRAPGGPADYLFLRDVNDLDLTGVGLVTLSACETARGKVIRGEGVESFSRALLAAGAGAVVTTLWDVVDRPSAEFMTAFYASAGGGHGTAGALRDAKLEFLRSDLGWSHPYYWAGYLLTGNGRNPLRRVVPWSAIAASTLVVLIAFSAALRAGARGTRSRLLRRTANRSRRSAPTR
jgi:tetratricopeptide (TPR) repeat protein